MPTIPIRESAVDIDLSPRFSGTSTVLNSPIAAAAETIIASVTLPDFGSTAIVARVRLEGFAAFTVGTNGVAATLRIRQTDASGSVIASTGATTVTAANLVARSVLGADAAPGVATYVLTLEITSGSANTTVSGVYLAQSTF
jgi:hypothetical protein